MTTLTTTKTDLADFEAVYAAAAGNAALIPWADSQPSSALVNWLNAVAPTLVRCGSRVAVVGCGLGHDVAELCRRGYEVIGFDCSQTAIQWAKRLHPQHEGSLVCADLFDPPARWRHRFDLVVEVNTLQSLPPETRNQATVAIADLISMRGHLLAICRAARESRPLEDGPPWPLTREELLEATSLAGLVPHGEVSVFLDGEQSPVSRMRGVFTRA